MAINTIASCTANKTTPDILVESHIGNGKRNTPPDWQVPRRHTSTGIRGHRHHQAEQQAFGGPDDSAQYRTSLRSRMPAFWADEQGQSTSTPAKDAVSPNAQNNKGRIIFGRCSPEHRVPAPAQVWWPPRAGIQRRSRPFKSTGAGQGRFLIPVLLAATTVTTGQDLGRWPFGSSNKARSRRHHG